MKRGCTQCGECLNVCPVFLQFRREEYSPKAKRLLMEPLAPEYGGSEETALLQWEAIRKYARLCVGCGRCQKACARKLSTSDLLSDIRSHHPHWTQHFWKLWIAHMGPLWPSLGLLASLVPDKATPAALRPLHGAVRSFAEKTPKTPWGKLRKSQWEEVDTSRPVMLFSGCTANYVRRQWTDKAQAMLSLWGYTLVDSSGFTCCGGSLHHAGQYEKMREMEQQNIALWRAAGKPKIAVLCASCYGTLVKYGEKVLEGTEAKEWKKSVYPLTRFLNGARLKATSAMPNVSGYHAPCHWGNKDNDAKWLAKLIPGLQKGKHPCCGMGGILQMSNPGLSRSLAESTLAGFPPATQHILTGCSGCVMQLNAAAGSEYQVMHWLDIMDVE